MKNPSEFPPSQSALLSAEDSASKKSAGSRIWQCITATATGFVGASLGVFAPIVAIPLNFRISFVSDYAFMAGICIVPGLVAGLIASHILHLPRWCVFGFRISVSAISSYLLLAYIASVLSRM